MKQRIVMWGNNAAGDKVLIASRLDERANKVETTLFPGDQVTEEFVNTMMNAWREGNEISFPEPFETTEKPLTVTESFLPEGVTPDREDVIKRAQTEWNFVVMSVKLSDVYYKEMEEIKERISHLNAFDNKVWEELKGFWGKVQTQIRENNIIRDHAHEIKENTNQLFSRLKELRKKMDEEFKALSEENKERFEAMVESVEERINQGKGLQPIFEELKDLQRQLKKTKFTRDHRNKLWNRIDAAFKQVKEKRFGDKQQGKSPLGRLERRYEGLLNAIRKMDNSIKRDEKDLEFQDRRMEDSMGQLELEMRKAKVKMIEERVRSKKEKLEDMQKTKAELENRMEKEKQREARRKEEEKKAEAMEKAKEELARKMEEQKRAMEEQKEELEKAAKLIADSKPEAKPTQKESKPEEKQSPAATTTSTINAEDSEGLYNEIVDSIAAITEIVHSKAETSDEEE